MKHHTDIRVPLAHPAALGRWIRLDRWDDGAVKVISVRTDHHLSVPRVVATVADRRGRTSRLEEDARELVSVVRPPRISWFPEQVYFRAASVRLGALLFAVSVLMVVASVAIGVISTVNTGVAVFLAHEGPAAVWFALCCFPATAAAQVVVWVASAVKLRR